MARVSIFRPVPPAEPQEQVRLVYALEGEVDSVDVFALAPALLSLGSLIQNSARTLNQLDGRVAVNVRPFRPGSFHVDIVLFGQHAQEIAQGTLGPVLSATRIIDVLKAIGLVKDLRDGAIQVLKKLGRKPAQIEEVRPGEFRLTAGDTSITVNGNVHTLIQNQTVMGLAEKTYGDSMKDPGVKAVRSFLSDQEDETAVSVTKDELPSLRAAVFDEPQSERTTVATTVVHLNPKRAGLDGDGKNWSFHRGDSIVTATIRDKEFLERCRTGEVRLGGRDLLTVELRETTTIQGTVVHTSYEIIKVRNHVAGTGELLPEPRSDE